MVLDLTSTVYCNLTLSIFNAMMEIVSAEPLGVMVTQTALTPVMKHPRNVVIIVVPRNFCYIPLITVVIFINPFSEIPLLAIMIPCIYHW